MGLLPELPFQFGDTVTADYLVAVGARSLRALIILLAAFIGTQFLARIIRAFSNRVRKTLEEHGGESRLDQEKRVKTLSRILRLTVSVTIWLVAVMMALREVGYDVGPILAGAGVVGLAVGFGAQNLVRDVITGLFMLLENQVLVGDNVVINGQAGTVEEVNLRTIVLRDGEGAVHTFANGAVSALANKTRDYSYHVFSIAVAYNEDTDRVTNLIRRVASEMRDDPTVGRLILGDFDIWGVDSLGPSGVIIKGRVKTKVGEQAAVGRELNRRVKRLFEAEGIEVPTTQTNLSLSEAAIPLTLSDSSVALIRDIVREELARASKPAENPNPGSA